MEFSHYLQASTLVNSGQLLNKLMSDFFSCMCPLLLIMSFVTTVIVMLNYVYSV